MAATAGCYRKPEHPPPPHAMAYGSLPGTFHRHGICPRAPDTGTAAAAETGGDGTTVRKGTTAARGTEPATERGDGGEATRTAGHRTTYPGADVESLGGGQQERPAARTARPPDLG